MKPKHAKKKVKPWVPETYNGFTWTTDNGKVGGSFSGVKSDMYPIAARIIREKDYQRLLKLASQSGRGER